MAFLLGGVLILVAWRWSTDRAPAKPTDLRPHRVELNRATSNELQQLPGVGPKTAEAILNHREVVGDFSQTSNLTSVQGIGKTKLARWEPWIEVEGASEEGDTVAPFPSQPRSPGENPPSKTKPLPIQPINPNTATEEELRTLPGVGPVIAQRIIAERTRKPFGHIDELRRVSGIGPKTLEKIRPHIIVPSN